MSRILILATILFATHAYAAESKYLVDGREATKVEALLALVKDKDAKVYKLTPLMITKNATLKTKGSED